VLDWLLLLVLGDEPDAPADDVEPDGAAFFFRRAGRAAARASPSRLGPSSSFADVGSDAGPLSSLLTARPTTNPSSTMASTATATAA
jgi:hypothetical protein